MGHHSPVRGKLQQMGFVWGWEEEEREHIFGELDVTLSIWPSLGIIRKSRKVSIAATNILAVPSFS